MNHTTDPSHLLTMETMRKQVHAVGWVKRACKWLGGAAIGHTQTSQNPKKDGQLPGLYGLRAIAALMIVLFHLATNVRVPEVFSVIKTHFGQGVALFFVLSGFSLMYSTSRYIGRDGWVEIYLIKRFFRIAPLFYVMLIFFSICNIFVWNSMPAPGLIIIDILFLYNLVPGYHESLVWAGWTLGVEMPFYALFPLLLITITNFRRAILLFIISVVASFVAYQLLAAKGQDAYASLSLIVNAPYFIAGVMTFFLFKRHADIKRNPLLVGALCAISSAIVIGAIVFNKAIGGFIYGHRLYIAAWAVVFGLLCVWQSLYPSKLLSLRPFQFCGERSYSIYLVHAIIVYSLRPMYPYIYGVIGNDMLAFILCVVVALTAVLCVASVTFYLVEMPGIKLGALVIERRRRGMVVSVPRTLPMVSE